MLKQKKYVAMLMNRQFIGENRNAFIGSHAVVGSWDSKREIFIDQSGKQYYSMTDPKLIESNIPYAYGSIIEKRKLPEFVTPDASTFNMIREFEEKCKNILFFIGKNEDGKYFCVSLPISQIMGVGDAVPTDDTYDYMDDDPSMGMALEEIQENVIKGEFTLEELRRIRDNLTEEKEDISSVLDTVELQIESDENNIVDGEYRKLENQEKLKMLPMEKEDPSANRINIEELFRQVTSTLIAQDEPARRVIAEIARKELDIRKKKEGILLTGATGVGKTELMRLIAKYLNRPFFKVNTTQLTVPGYVGKDIEEVLWDLYLQCNKDKQQAERAIIFFDEIDKKGSSKKSDVSGQGVLNVLLPFIEGSSYDACADSKHTANSVKIKTDNMIVIFGGAYTDVYKNLVVKNGIGFGEKVSTGEKYREATTKDFIEKGMMTDEFMGRVTVVKLNDLDVNAIKRIMLESNESAIKIQEGIFSQLGVKITFTDSYLEAVAKRACEKKTGARGLNGVIDDTTWIAFEEVYSHPEQYGEVILNEDTLENPKNYQLIKKA